MPPETPTDKTARHDGWGTLRRFLPYLWPQGAPGLRGRIVLAMLLVLASKAVQLSMGFVYGAAIDRMTPALRAELLLPIALVVAYAGASGRDIKELLKLTLKFCKGRNVLLSEEAFAQCAAFRSIGKSV